MALICEAPVTRRAELLDLVAAPDAVIPRIPPAELCFIAKAVGLGDAGWILEHASEEQIVACVDLDAWKGALPETSKLDEWLAALADAGEETLLRGARSLDMELLVLEVASRVQVTLVHGEDMPPTDAHTIDGQFYLAARTSGDDLEDLLSLLQALFQHDYWMYFRLLQGTLWELPSGNEEWALRWRSGRLQDLGFPPLDDAKRIYAHLRSDQLAALPASDRPHEVGEWPLPVWMPALPAALDRESALLRAFAGLAPEARRPQLLAFLALANRVAVADELALGDAETLPVSLAKALRVASRGLEHVAEANAIGLVETLHRTSLERLFRVGHQLKVE